MHQGERRALALQSVQKYFCDILDKLELAYRITKHIALGVGYRYYSLDLDAGSFEIHQQNYGPLVGLTFSF